jgi:hypothetical protein
MNETILPTAEALIQSIPLFNNIVLAILIFFTGLIIGRIMGKIIEKTFSNIELDKIMYNKGFSFSIQKLSFILISTSIYIIFFILALNQLGITHLLFSILIIALLTLLLLTIMLSAKEDLPNMLAYRKIKKIPEFKIGEELNSTYGSGEIIKITKRQIQIKTKQEDVISIPHSILLKELEDKKNKSI